MSWKLQVTAAMLIAAAACAKRDEATEAVASGASSTCGLAGEDLGRFVLLEGGSFIMGAVPIYADEGPSARVHVDPFFLQTHEVTVAEFAAFISATGYRTDAEREANQGGSAIFVAGPQGGWRIDSNADWRNGADGGAAASNAPVVHVSRNDAAAYAVWVGGRLPTEVEWEYAAVTGMASDQSTTPSANVWQGIFPLRDEGTDGFQTAAPVGCFGANANGLYDMIGNVWEWTSTDYPHRTGSAQSGLIKGGSYLCSDTFCRRFRPEARQPQDIDFSASHIGFRVARDVK